MKSLKLLKLSIDNLLLNLSKSISYILVFSISLILISFAIFTSQGIQLAYNICNRTLTNGMNNSGVVRVMSHDIASERGINFVNELMGIDAIESIGYCVLAGNNSFRDLVKIQDGHAQNYEYTLTGNLEILFMSPSLWNLCDIEISNGTLPQNLEFSRNHFFLYLGSAYNETIEIGKIYEYNGLSYEVMGFIKEGGEWINPQIVNGFNVSTISFGLEYAVIMLDDMPASSALLFSTEHSMIETQNLIKELADKHGFEIAIGTLQSLYEETASDNEVLLSYLLQLIFIVLISAIIIMTCLSVVTIYSNRNLYGIFLSSGFFQSDIIKMLGFEMCVKMFFRC